MLSKEQLKILELWLVNPFAELTISEIMKKAEKKTKTWVFNTLKILSSKNYLICTRKGNLNLYGLDLDNPRTTKALQFLESQKNISKEALIIITEIIKKIKLKNCCFVLFGSFSKNKQSLKSDLDICFLVESNDIEKIIKPYINKIKTHSIIEIDDHYITFKDFAEMLLNDEENLAKQIFRNHAIFLNNDIFYESIKEAYKNGFRP